MLKTKILKQPVILQTERRLWGSHASGWQINSPSPDSLPRFSTIETLVPDDVWKSKKTALFLPEIACFPIRVPVEEKVKTSELEHFLKWTLKSRLPFPLEDAWIRYMPIHGTSSWLVFSLPGSWVQDTFDFFNTKGVHLGYIGTIAGLILESMRAPDMKVLLSYYGYYIYIHQKSGKLNQFQIRRFPIKDGQIQFEEFINSDFPMETSSGSQNPVPIYCFSHGRQKEWNNYFEQHGPGIFQMHEANENMAQLLVQMGRKT